VREETRASGVQGNFLKKVSLQPSKTLDGEKLRFSLGK
jgi:hypothetical protein